MYIVILRQDSTQVMSLKNWLMMGSLKRKSGDGKHNFKGTKF
jgi:hypothetical protein